MGVLLLWGDTDFDVLMQSSRDMAKNKFQKGIQDTVTVYCYDTKLEKTKLSVHCKNRSTVT